MQYETYIDLSNFLGEDFLLGLSNFSLFGYRLFLFSLIDKFFIKLIPLFVLESDLEARFYDFLVGKFFYWLISEI